MKQVIMNFNICKKHFNSKNLAKFFNLLIFLSFTLEIGASTVSIGTAIKWGNLEPGKSNSGTTSMIQSVIFETLFNENVSGTFKSRVVEWRFLDDNKLSIKVNQNIFFSDGSKLNSTDVLFSLLRNNVESKEGPLPFKHKNSELKYKLLNERELLIYSSINISGILRDLSNSTYLIYKKINDKILGTGVYKIERDDLNKLVLTANSYYPNNNRPTLELSEVIKNKKYDVYSYLPPELNCGEKGLGCTYSLPKMRNFLSLNSTDNSFFKEKKLRRSFLGLIYSLTKDSLYKDPDILKSVKRTSRYNVQLFADFQKGRLKQSEVDQQILFDKGAYFKKSIGNKKIKFIHNKRSKLGPYLIKLLSEKAHIKFTEDSGGVAYEDYLNTLYNTFNSDVVLRARSILGNTEYDSVSTLFNDKSRTHASFDSNPRLVKLY